MMPPMVHGWWAGSPQFGKPVATNSCGVHASSKIFCDRGDVRRADLEHRREHVVLLDQLGGERRRLGRVVRVVLRDRG